MANKTVVGESNNVSASQLKDFFRQIDERLIDGETIQMVLEKDHRRLSFFYRIHEYLKSISLRAMSFEEIAVGIFIIYDDKKEYDIYFDESLWELESPQAWANKPGSKGLGIIETIGNCPQNEGFEPARHLAKQILKQKVLWY